MSDPCPDDFMLVPTVQSRVCGTPASTVTGCPPTEYPVVVAQAAVPAHDSNVWVSVSPITGFTPGMWVTLATGNGAAPFTGRIVAKDETSIQIRNSMPNGGAILANPPMGTSIVQCGAVAIVSEPGNVSVDPDDRCTRDMTPHEDSDPISMQGLTRADTIEDSLKCSRFIHNVGANEDTLWVKVLPAVEPEEDDDPGRALVLWNQTNGLLQKFNKTSDTHAFVRMKSGGKVFYTDTLDGAALTAKPVPGLPEGVSQVFWDPAEKVFYHIPSQDGKYMRGEGGTWAQVTDNTAISGVLAKSRTDDTYPSVTLVVPSGKTYSVDVTVAPSSHTSNRFFGVLVTPSGGSPERPDGDYCPGENAAGDFYTTPNPGMHVFELGSGTYTIAAQGYSDLALTNLTGAQTPTAGGRHFIKVVWYCL